jgi:hypothetical protein
MTRMFPLGINLELKVQSPAIPLHSISFPRSGKPSCTFPSAGPMVPWACLGSPVTYLPQASLPTQP